MIIVSKDKTATINFKNIETLYLTRREDKNGKKTVEINARGKYDYTLGEYKTEERAKEVLKEIINKYLEYATVKNGIGEVKQVHTIPKIYEMPED